MIKHLYQKFNQYFQVQLPSVVLMTGDRYLWKNEKLYTSKFNMLKRSKHFWVPFLLELYLISLKLIDLSSFKKLSHKKFMGRNANYITYLSILPNGLRHCHTIKVTRKPRYSSFLSHTIMFIFLLYHGWNMCWLFDRPIARVGRKLPLSTWKKTCLGRIMARLKFSFRKKRRNFQSELVWKNI